MIFYCCRMQSQRSRLNTNNLKRTNLWQIQQTENNTKENSPEEDDDDYELEQFKKRMQIAPPRYYLVQYDESEDQSSSDIQQPDIDEYKQSRIIQSINRRIRRK